MRGSVLLSLLALIPIALVLVAMIRLDWRAWQAGVAGWALALLLALTTFRAPLPLLVAAHGRALLLSLFVLYIIWTALLLYHVVNEAGVIEDISDGVTRLTGDPLIQFLILAWIFASFLQGVTGFGVPVAVVTPLLIGLGFSPMLSVVAAGVAHSWAVTFGSGGTSFFTLIAVTSLPGESLAAESSLLLGLACFLCGGATAHLYGGWRGVGRSALFVLPVGAVMAASQWALAVAGYYAIASFGACLAGFAAAIPLARLPFYRGQPTAPRAGARRLRERLPRALAAYILLLVIVIGADAIPAVNALLNRVELNLTFAGYETGLGWQVPGGPGRSISLFGHVGALIGYSALLGGLLYWRWGRYGAGAGRRIVRGTLARSRSATMGIVTLIAMAVVMDNSGMIFAIADGLRRLVPGGLYPLAAPFIGTLGAFMTGSNTNSNVLFAPLQEQVAALLGLSVPAILAAQTAGGALGSMLAPAKILVGASTANVAGREGEVLRLTIPYALVLLVVIGVVTVLIS